MMMMTMYFHQRLEEIILFKQWTTATPTGFALSCLVICFSAMLYELLRSVRSVLEERFSSRKACCDADIYYYSHQRSQQQPTQATSQSNNAAVATICECEKSPRNESKKEKEPLKPDNLTRRQLHLHSSAQTILYGVQLWWSFCLMLMAMTYNWCLFGSLVVGHALGYAFAGPMFDSVKQELRIGECACA